MKLNYVFALTIISLLNLQCKKTNEDIFETPTTASVNNFIWKAMNQWYYWEKESQQLSDNKLNNETDYINFLNKKPNHDEFFNSLLYQKGVIDRYSWFIEDYEEQQKAFQGITTSFGFKYGLVKFAKNIDNLAMYITYVSPDSPANKAGFKRGDIIGKINGETITTINKETLIKTIKNNPEVTFSFTEKDGLKVTETKTIQQEVVLDNPVYLSKTFDIDGKKVGYLVYNSFRSSYNDELNKAFGSFKTEGIRELILDFRLNPGGSVETCTYLASMIYGEGSGTFAKLLFNQKNPKQNKTYSFSDDMAVYNAQAEKVRTEKINRLLGLSKIYVITSYGTASASEMIINGLRPFIDVITVGGKTYGKNVGSITLFDSPSTKYTSRPKSNPNHKYAMQPIAFSISNKNDENDYANGFQPTITISEAKSWNFIRPFGDKKEVLLKAVLDDINGVEDRTFKNQNSEVEQIFSKYYFDKFETDMYVPPSFFQK